MTEQRDILPLPYPLSDPMFFCQNKGLSPQLSIPIFLILFSLHQLTRAVLVSVS